MTGGRKARRYAIERAAVHTNPLASAQADKTFRNTLIGLFQQALVAGSLAMTRIWILPTSHKRVAPKSVTLCPYWCIRHGLIFANFV